jgi:hypothetical protein
MIMITGLTATILSFPMVKLNASSNLDNEKKTQRILMIQSKSYHPRKLNKPEQDWNPNQYHLTSNESMMSMKKKTTRRESTNRG